MIRKQYLTNNIFYYFLCIFFRFIYIIIIAGDYPSVSSNENSKSFQKFIRILTLNYLLKKINISFKIYCFVILIILIFAIIIIIENIFILKKLQNYKYTYKWPIPSKLQIIFGHINFLLFPFIIEYLSFAYYIYCLPDNFIIKSNKTNEKYILIFILQINTILIIIYNIDNYIWIFCSNKSFTVSIFEANLRTKEKEQIKNNNPISYRCSILGYCILIFLQNTVIISNLEQYIKTPSYKISFNILISLIVFLNIIIFFINKINKFNYLNYINTFVNVLLLLCLNSIIFDTILYFIGYRKSNLIKEVIYLLLKLVLGLITYLSFVLKSHKFLESKICEILFQEKNSNNENYFVNCLYLLHQILLIIKDNNKIEYTNSLFQLINKHINYCHKINCNCKFFDKFGGKNYRKNKNDTSKKNLFENLNILNYLLESVFIETNFYNNYELTIILAEHF